MCGIVAVLLGEEESSVNYKVFDLLLLSLRALQSRGYDSCGILDSTFRSLIKAVKRSELDNLSDNQEDCPEDAIDQIYSSKNTFPDEAYGGIAHTRWATSGKKTVANAHPHLSYDGDIAVIHNGIIENYLELKKSMERDGIKFRSDTDTEVISNWIAQRLDKNPSKEDIIRSLYDAQRKLEGSWGVALSHKRYPDSVFLLKNGSPLLVGYNRKTGMIMASSEIAGFVNKVDMYSILEDNEILCLTRGQDINSFVSNMRYLKFRSVSKEVIKINPDPYPHWMTKEIYDQIKAVESPADWGVYRDHIFGDYPELKSLFPLQERLINNGSFDVLLVGCGTSYHAGLAGRWFFRSVPFRTVRVVVASEFTDQDIPKSDDNNPSNVLAIMISQSGETKDVHRALNIIKKYKTPTIALVNVQDSLIARESDIAVYLHAGREVAVASTKAYSSQLVGLKLLALALQEGRSGKVTKDFLNLSDQIKETLEDILPYYVSDRYIFEPSDKISDIARSLNDKNHGFVLSSGILRAVSYEAALKIKEIGRVWIQGYPTGALKHGPFSLLEKGTPVILSLQDNNDSILRRTESAIEEVHARGAVVFVTTDIQNYKNKQASQIIVIPRNETFSPILNILPYQALSYCLANIRGLDADKPKHLAKVVTTD